MNPIGRLHQERDGLRVVVHGDVNYESAGDLRNLLASALEHLPARLVVDLAQVNYMDSSGIAVLVESLQVQRKRGLELTLCGLQPRVRSLFEIARLGSLFTLQDLRATG
jgi:anti-sigma B factor antagonist